MSGGKPMFLGTVSPSVDLWFLLVVLPCLNLLGRLNHDLIATSLESAFFKKYGNHPQKMTEHDLNITSYLEYS